MTFDKNSAQSRWSTIYYNKNDNETLTDIAKAIVGAYNTIHFVGQFKTSKHTPAGCSPIKNDDNLFIIQDIYGVNGIWQVGGNYADMHGQIVPHLYKVRQIGIMVE